MSYEQEYRELTLKDIILEIQRVFRLLLGQWKWILAAGLLVGALLAGRNLLSTPVYKEKLTFMMDEKAGSDIPGIELLGSLFGQGGGGDDNLGKLLQLFESKRIIHNALLQTIDMNGEIDLLANHMIDLYGIDDLTRQYKKFGLLWSAKWPQDLAGMTNPRITNTDLDSLAQEERLLLRLLFDKINGNDGVGIPQMLTSELDAESSIMTLEVKSEHPQVTLALLTIVYEQLSDFFIQTTVEKQQKTYDIVSQKRDSIVAVLQQEEYRLANFKDRNRNLVTVKGYLDELRLERQVQILNVMYGEVIKQMEATDFALRNKTPVVQIIDRPRAPIFPTKASTVKGFIVGVVIGGLCLALWFVARDYYRQIMSEDA